MCSVMVSLSDGTLSEPSSAVTPTAHRRGGLMLPARCPIDRVTGRFADGLENSSVGWGAERTWRNRALYVKRGPDLKRR